MLDIPDISIPAFRANIASLAILSAEPSVEAASRFELAAMSARTFAGATLFAVANACVPTSCADAASLDKPVTSDIICASSATSVAPNPDCIASAASLTAIALLFIKSRLSPANAAA